MQKGRLSSFRLKQQNAVLPLDHPEPFPISNFNQKRDHRRSLYEQTRSSDEDSIRKFCSQRSIVLITSQNTTPRSELSLTKHSSDCPTSQKKSMLHIVRSKPSVVAAAFSFKFQLLKLVTNRGTQLQESEKQLIQKLVVSNSFPLVYRSSLWLLLTGATRNIRNNPLYYESLLHNYPDFIFYRHIQLDLLRTFQDEKYFRQKPIIKSLKRVLVAYARRNPQIGYCQGFNFIVARLLKLFSEEQSFWIFTYIIESLMPLNYYSDMIGMSVDAEIFKILLRERFPTLMRKLTFLDVEISCASWQWFVTLFSYNLQPEELYRFWDLVFLRGSVMLFELSLCIIAVTEKKLMKKEDAASILLLMPSLARLALEDKPQFFKTFSNNKKCRVSQKWLEKMRTVYERDFFAKRSAEMQERGERPFCITKGLLLKETPIRLEKKPILNDMETCSGFWNKNGCQKQWPLCTHIGSSPIELSCFVFRASERSYEINEDYFYGAEETTQQKRTLRRGESEEYNDFQGNLYNGMLILRQTHLCH